MNNTTVNFTDVAPTKSIYDSLLEMTSLDICVYYISILPGFPTHSYVIWLIITGTGSGVATEFFNLNLSFCEIGICLNSLLCLVYSYTGIPHVIRLAWFLLGTFITGRPLFQCLICVERYLAVVHPVTFLKYKPLRYRVICCTVAWIITLGSCLCCIFLTEQLLFRIYIYFYMIQFLLFFLIQLFCLVAVLRALKQTGPGENHIKRKAFYLILITAVNMFIIYVPFIILGFIFFLMQWIIVALSSFSYLCFILAGFVQPVLYLHRVGKLSCVCSLLNI